MLIIKLEKNVSIDRALKNFKYKFQKTGVIKEIRDRKQFTKQSVKRREEVMNAKYKQGLNNNED